MKRPWLKRSLQLFWLALLAVILVPLIGVGIECRVWASVTPAPTAISPAVAQAREGLRAYARLEVQSYLTLPEWYVVYSADEYAAFIAKNPPSQFPYFSAIGQYWRSYYDTCAVTRAHYPFDALYHFTLAVVGVNFTLENIGRGVYENTVGRLTEALSTDELTEEDVYARVVAKEFGDFIHTIPWFDFPYAEKLQGLWSRTSGWGPNVIRKWERKLALSFEYSLKAFYSWVMRQGAKVVYAPEDLEIQAWAEGVSADLPAREPPLRLVKPLGGQTAIIALPRYQAFTQLVPRLTKQGVQFVEIAGNDEILMTALAPRTWTYDLPDGKFLFALPILTQPALKRIAVSVPVKALHRVLADLESRGVKFEHLYDY